jgi:hypothetical protein
MLMQADYLNLVFGGDLPGLLELALINSEFTFGTASDHVCVLTGSYLRVYSQKNLFAFELILEKS